MFYGIVPTDSIPGAFMPKQDVYVAVDKGDKSSINVTVLNTDQVFNDYDVSTVTTVTIKINDISILQTQINRDEEMDYLTDGSKVFLGGKDINIPDGFLSDDNIITVEVKTTYWVDNPEGPYSVGTLTTTVELQEATSESNEQSKEESDEEG